MFDVLADLQNRYKAQCNGDWEHNFGIKIDNIDNPGWSVLIDLDGTLLETKPFTRIKRFESPTIWMECWVEDGKFKAFGAPDCLVDILTVFVEWAKTEPDWLGVPTDEFFENRENSKYWQSLDEESSTETCRLDGCTRARLKYAGLCRIHQYESRTGNQAPDHD